MLECSRCGADNPDNSNFCGQCGAELAMNCPACGHRNPPSYKYCNHCGAPLTATPAAVPLTPLPAHADRRLLTVMFCDLVGSTELSVRLDPEDLRKVLRGYQACCKSVIERYGGYIARYMGDGILVHFGYPRATEHDPERAVRAGLEMIGAVSRLELHPNLILQARVGIATGEVVAGDAINQGAAEEQAAVGNTPNLAARLQSLAEPNTVMIADSTKRLLGGLFEYLDCGRHTLKGFFKPVQVWRVAGERSGVNRFEVIRGVHGLTPLVGREREIRLLRQSWRRARAGTGQTVLIGGESGIGKSRIVQTLRQHLAGQAYTRVSCYCSPYHQNSALFPVIDHMMRAACFERNDTPAQKLDKLEALLARSLEDVAAIAPLFAALLSIPADQRYAPLSLHPQRQKEQTLAALEAQIGGLTKRQPVLMIFEDMHWVDPTTLELLERIVAAVRDLPMLIVMTFRPDFEPPWGNAANVSALDLARLSREQCAAVVDRLTAGKHLPAVVLEQILDKTDGVPLFVEELTRTVLEAGFLSDTGDKYILDGPLPPLAIPDSVRNSLMARLDRLSPLKEIVQIGAAIGRQFSYEMLAALSPIGEQGLEDALQRLSDAHLVHCRGAPPGSIYTFKHALVQDVAYHSILRSKRQSLHGRIAEVLRERFPDQAETAPELLARHYTEAHLPAEAVEYWLKAGQRALARSAYAEAIHNLNDGLALLEQLPTGIARNRWELRLQTARAAALSVTKGFAAPETGSIYAWARELCGQLGETPEIFPVLYGIYRFYTVRGSYSEAHAVAQECLRRAQQQQDDTPQLIGHRLMGSSLYMNGEFNPAREHLEQALALYDSRRHESSAYSYGVDHKTGVLVYLSQTLFVLGYPEKAHQVVEQGLAHAERLGHSHNLGFALNWFNIVAIYSREYDVIGDRAERLIQLASEQGFSFLLAQARFHYGTALTELGAVDEGIAEIRRGISEHQATGVANLPPFLLCLLARAIAKSGQHEEAVTLLSEALTETERTGERWFEAELYRLKGELLRQGEAIVLAQDCFEQALTISRSQGARAWELRAATSLARLWRVQGKAEQARALLAPVYNGFEEGFTTADLEEARRLLIELNHLE